MRSVCRVLLAACLLLSGCASGQEAPPRFPLMTDLPPEELAASRNLSFLVSGDADPVLREAAELFADKLTELTEGGLAITVSASVDADGDFRAGRAQLAFLDGGGTDNPENDLALLCGAMRYQNYETFTMGLNSRRTLDALNDRLDRSGVLLLAAFYQGFSQLVADRSLVGGELLGDPVVDEYAGEGEGDGQPTERAELAAAVRAGSVLGPVLEEYGMLVQETESFDQRALLMSRGEVNAAEFSAAELETVMLPAGTRYIITNHSTAPLWLAVKPSAYNGLPDEYKAAVAEACSYLFPLIDEHYRGRDARNADRLMIQGVRTENRFDGLRDAANALLEEQPPEDPVQRYLLAILSGLS